MTTITTRAGKGSELTWSEVDANFTGLRDTADAALPKAGGTMTGALTLKPTHSGSLDIIKHDASDATNNGGYSWKMLYDGGGSWANGPPAETNYIDDVWTMGIGIGSTVGTRAPGQAALAITMESKYYSGPSATSPWSEFHITHIGTNDVERRIMSFVGAHDDSYIGGGFQTDVLNFYDRSGAQRIKFDMANATTVVSLVNETNFRGMNNAPILQQLNAAGNAYKNLPFLDDDDRLRAYLPAAFMGQTPTTGLLPNTCFAVLATTAPPGGRVFYSAGPAVTGSLFGGWFEASATADFTVGAYNTNDTSTTSQVRFWALAVGSYCDPFIQFTINGAVDWSVGADNSEGDAFKICKAGAIGSNDALSIDTNLNVALGSAALATNATDGFFYTQSCAGAPSGVPTSKTGRVPTVVDTTNGRAYFYYGGGWHYTTLT